MPASAPCYEKTTTMKLDPKHIFAYLKATSSEKAPDTVQLGGPDSLLTRPFVGRLFITLAHDFDDAFGLLQRRHLAELGMNDNEAFELGLRNLTTFAESGAVRIDQSSRVFAFTAGGNFEASLLLVDKLWQSMSGRIGSVRLLARAPARDLLMIAPDDKDGRAELEALAARLKGFKLDHPLTDDLLTWDGSRWSIAD